MSETTQSACFYHDDWGMLFWTAGQRIDPTTESAFVWRLTSTDGSTVHPMNYTDWMPGQPNNWGVAMESCVMLASGISYKWNDGPCSRPWCSVCEL